MATLTHFLSQCDAQRSMNKLPLLLLFLFIYFLFFRSILLGFKLGIKV